jgi:hypothetical protein
MTHQNPQSDAGAPEHLLDGTSLDFHYQSGSAIHMEISDGKLAYEWITGPSKGSKAMDIPYRSRKIGDDLYIVNWHEKDKPDFVTLIFNFRNHVVYSSALRRYRTDREEIHFQGGIMQHVTRRKTGNQ